MLRSRSSKICAHGRVHEHLWGGQWWTQGQLVVESRPGEHRGRISPAPSAVLGARLPAEPGCGKARGTDFRVPREKGNRPVDLTLESVNKKAIVQLIFLFIENIFGITSES